MALDFPSNPVDGQIYGNYQWSSSSGAWKGRPQLQQTSTQSPTAPTSPNIGDIWVDTTDGSSFYWYDDGTSKQWVEFMSSGIPATPVSIATGGTGATTVAAAQTALQMPLSPNYVINGGFDIWQRGTTFNAVPAYTYCADRWQVTYKDSGITLNASQQTFTPGSAPAAGNEGQYFLRLSNSAYTTGHTYYFAQKVEDVRTLAGQTVTLSYWARVSSGMLTPSRVFLNQNFGSGGSSEVDNIGSTQPTYTTSWQRFSQTATLPSVAGKTIGSSSFVYVLWQITPNANVTLDLWGVQLEAGSVATPFRRNAPSIQAELAACQRYYRRGQIYASGATGGGSAEVALVAVQFPIPMRVTPYAISWISGGVAMDGSTDKNITGLYSGFTNGIRNASVNGGEMGFTTVSTWASVARPVTVREAIVEFNAEL